MPKIGESFRLKWNRATCFEVVGISGEFVVMKRQHEGGAYDVAPVESFRSLQSVFVRLH